MRSDGHDNRRGLERRSYSISAWYDSPWKRDFDIFAATVLLILLLPLMLVVALLVKITSPGPILFRQRRPGRDGREFYILKFRTMIDGGHRAGPAFTRPCDPRITPLGAFLRKWKLDEFPQLFNVLRGEMSFVGPRPLPTSHWEQAATQAEALCVLSVRPGVTSRVTLSFRNEEHLLAGVGADEVKDLYMTALMPLKTQMEAQALQAGSLGSDLRILIETVLRVFSRREQKDDLLVKERLLGRQEREHASVAEPREQPEYLPAGEHSD